MAGNSVELKGYENVPREQLTPCFPMMALARLAVTPSESDYDGSFGFDWLEYDGRKYTYAQRTDINKLEKYVEFNGGVATFKTPGSYEEKEKVLLEEYEKFTVPGYADKPVASSYLHMPKDKEPVKLKLHLFPLSKDEKEWKENELTIEAPVGLEVTLNETKGFKSKKTLDLTIANNGTGKRTGIIKFIDKNEVLVGQIFVQPPDEPIELKVRFVALVEQSNRKADKKNNKTAAEQQEEQHKERCFDLLSKDVTRYNAQTESYVQWNRPEKMIQDINKWFRQTGIKFIVDKPIHARDFLVYDKSSNEWKDFIKKEKFTHSTQLNNFLYNRYKNQLIAAKQTFSENQIYVFITKLSKEPNEDSTETGGQAMATPIDCNAVVIFDTARDKVKTYVHELGHLLGLEHTFLEKGDEERFIENYKRMSEDEENIEYNLDIDYRYLTNIHEDKALTNDQKKRLDNLTQEQSKLDINKAEDSKRYGEIVKEKNRIKAETIPAPDQQTTDSIAAYKEILDKTKGLLKQLRGNTLYFIQKETFNMMDYSEDAKSFFFNHKQWNTMCENSKYSR